MNQWIQKGTLSVFFTLIMPWVLFAQSGTVSGIVLDNATKEPLAAVTVAVANMNNRGAITDENGRYSIELPAGTYTLRVTYIGFKPERKVVNVDAGSSVQLDFEMTEDILGVSELVVIGSRSTDRSVIESAVPIDVVSNIDIQQFGFPQTTAVLRQLVPSFNSPKSSVTDGTDHINPATLRGLGPDQVLVLVNGKRRHTSSLVHVNGSIGRGATGVDLNAIPPSMIDRIEVLRDGAAAQYGSDAIAGVINIILKKQSGLDAMMTVGSNYSVTSRGYERNEALPSGFDPASWAGNEEFRDESVNYTDGQTMNLNLGYGGNLGKRGSYYVSGQFRNQDRTNRSGLDPRQQYPTLADGSLDPREQTFNRRNHRYGSADLQDISLFFNADYELDQNKSWYAFGGISKRVGNAAGFYRRALDGRNDLDVYPDGFLPNIDTDIADFSIATGLKGQFNGWNYDISETIGRNRLEFGVSNSINASLGVNSPSTFSTGALQFTQASTNVDLVRTVDIGTAKPLSVAVGGEFRYERYQIEPGDIPSFVAGPIPGRAAGAQVFPGFQPRNETDEDRTNVGLYLDLENDITDNFLLGVATRFESYSDFGSLATGKISGRYEFVEGLAMRGAISTGFRAPSLAQSYFSTIATNFIDGVPFEVGTFPVTSPVAQALGAQDLEEERSVNYSLGLTYTKGNFSLTVDAYQIDITDRVVLSENFTGSGSAGSIRDFLDSRGVNATGGRYFSNGVNSSTVGLDVVTRYAVQFGDDWTLRTTLSANFNRTEITNKDDIGTPTLLAQFTNVPLFGRVEQGRYEEGQPRSNVQSSFNLSKARHNLVVRVMRFGEFTTFNAADPLRDQEYSGKILTDIEWSFNAAEGYVFAIGSNNVFDVYPDRQLQPNSFNGIFQYSGQSPFGFDGRYVYARVQIKI